ncbi:transposase, partial [Candidatus Latescibacterota bacterium]
MKVGFDGGIKLEFHGAKVTSDGGLLAYRDLDHALGLFDSVSASFVDKRTGRNIRHAIPTLLRQSVYSRLAGYEDVNDAERLSIDPVMRAITGKKDKGKQAASANTMGRFETDILTQHDNLASLSDINGRWVQKAMSKTTHKRIII